LLIRVGLADQAAAGARGQPAAARRASQTDAAWCLDRTCGIKDLTSGRLLPIFKVVSAGPDRLAALPGSTLPGLTLMAKSNTVQIKLVSSADTGFFYVTKKNARAQTNKLELRKYDPVVRKHVAFKEAKIK